MGINGNAIEVVFNDCWEREIRNDVVVRLDLMAKTITNMDKRIILEKKKKQTWWTKMKNPKLNGPKWKQPYTLRVKNVI